MYGSWILSNILSYIDIMHNIYFYNHSTIFVKIMKMFQYNDFKCKYLSITVLAT